MGFGGGTDDSDKKRWRIVDSLPWTKGPLTGQATLVQFGKQGTPNTKETKFNSIGGRVAYAFTKNFKLQGELGIVQPQAAGRPDRSSDEVHGRADADGRPELLRPSGVPLLRVDVQLQRRVQGDERPDQVEQDGRRLPGRDVVLIG